TPAGKRLVTREVHDGSIFGVMGLLGQTMQGNFAQTVRDSVLLTLSLHQMTAYLTSQPGAALQVLEAVGTRLTEAEARLLEVAYYPVPVRVARFLLARTSPSKPVLTNITQDDVGDAVGALRQTVAAALARMRKDGLVRTGMRRIEVLAREQLEDIASM
ncbi:MAG: Crp/Fnr family transcriptional regulator, partial [Dehalococcoidia bacterium]